MFIVSLIITARHCTVLQWRYRVLVVVLRKLGWILRWRMTRRVCFSSHHELECSKTRCKEIRSGEGISHGVMREQKDFKICCGVRKSSENIGAGAMIANRYGGPGAPGAGRAGGGGERRK